MEYPSGWLLFKEFEEEVKRVNRFFPNPKFLRLFDIILENEHNIEIIKEETLLYRARINKPNEEYKFVSELGINRNSPQNNRASPIGIAYMYLADEPETSVSEVRANVNDNVTVATYNVKKQLKVFSLNNNALASGRYENEFDSLEIAGFILFLSYAFSVPIRNSGEIDYLPTQFFSEYCKRKGFDGVKYISSARGFHGYGGKNNNYNYVLFDDSNVDFKEAYKYKVNNIIYDIDKECIIHLKK